MTRFALELLDSPLGHPLQVWEFGSDDVVRIGRGPENDVDIASPFVSRSHACVRFDVDAGGWVLSVISRQGAFFDGQKIESLPLKPGITFRLAAKGPYLRMALDSSDHGESTISVNPHESPLLVLDRSERDHQVDEIAAGSYFQRLQQLAEQLRQRRSSS